MVVQKSQIRMFKFFTMSVKFWLDFSGLAFLQIMRTSWDFMVMMVMLWSILVNLKLTKLSTLFSQTQMLSFKLDQKLPMMLKPTRNSLKNKQQELINNGKMSNNSEKNQIPLSSTLKTGNQLSWKQDNRSLSISMKLTAQLALSWTDNGKVLQQPWKVKPKLLSWTSLKLNHLNLIFNSVLSLWSGFILWEQRSLILISNFRESRRNSRFWNGLIFNYQLRKQVLISLSWTKKIIKQCAKIQSRPVL